MADDGQDKRSRREIGKRTVSILAALSASGAGFGAAVGGHLPEIEAPTADGGWGDGYDSETSDSANSSSSQPRQIPNLYYHIDYTESPEDSVDMNIEIGSPEETSDVEFESVTLAGIDNDGTVHKIGDHRIDSYGKWERDFETEFDIPENGTDLPEEYIPLNGELGVAIEYKRDDQKRTVVEIIDTDNRPFDGWVSENTGPVNDLVFPSHGDLVGKIDQTYQQMSSQA